MHLYRCINILGRVRKIMFCRKCGNKIDEKSGRCYNCGYTERNRKNIDKLLGGIIVFLLSFAIMLTVIGYFFENSENTGNVEYSGVTENSQANNEIVKYEKTEIQTMIDDLNDNALKAEKTYNNKYIEITGKISNFDSSGNYINVKSVSAGKFDIFDDIQCYINNEEQLNYLLNKSVGDTVTVKGKVTSVGEVLGYSISISELA